MKEEIFSASPVVFVGALPHSLIARLWGKGGKGEKKKGDTEEGGKKRKERKGPKPSRLCRAELCAGRSFTTSPSALGQGKKRKVGEGGGGKKSLEKKKGKGEQEAEK